MGCDFRCNCGSPCKADLISGALLLILRNGINTVLTYYVYLPAGERERLEDTTHSTFSAGFVYWYWLRDCSKISGGSGWLLYF